MLVLTFPGVVDSAAGMPWRDHPAWPVVGEVERATGLDIEPFLLGAAPPCSEVPVLAAVALSLVVNGAVRDAGLAAGAVVGYGAGECAALVAAGALDASDGAALSAEWAAVDREARQSGSACTIAVEGLEDDDVEELCARVGGDVWVTAYEAPGRVLVGGHPGAVGDVADGALSLGARAVRTVDPTGAAHTPWMAPWRDRIKKSLGNLTWAPSMVPVVANVDGRPHGHTAEWPSLLAASLCNPVRWRHGLSRLCTSGMELCLEVGHGGLTEFVRRTAPGVRREAVGTPAALDAALRLLDDARSGLLSLASLGCAAGEHVEMRERLVVSPSTGIYQPSTSEGTCTAEGEIVQAGAVLGMVAGEPVCSRFSGFLMSIAVDAGQRIYKGQIVAVIRAF